MESMVNLIRVRWLHLIVTLTQKVKSRDPKMYTFWTCEHENPGSILDTPLIKTFKIHSSFIWFPKIHANLHYNLLTMANKSQQPCLFRYFQVHIPHMSFEVIVSSLLVPWLSILRRAFSNKIKLVKLWPVSWKHNLVLLETTCLDNPMAI